ncbi:hypothetical protein IAD21_00695 [Abditibacteriota bacterium]|nr:hypothetical protein IAD21_00695 [Abditibacteriota bacterium]
MSLSAQAPFVSVLVWPVDPEAANRSQWTLSENYAGCFQAGSDGGTDDGGGIPGFKSIQFPHQPALLNLQGPVDFVRFTAAGRVERGASAALQSTPDSELCGLTVQLRRESLRNSMQNEPHQSKAPNLPGSSPSLLWVTEAGAWETLVPVSSPFDSCVHPYNFNPNTAFKIKTRKPWDANRGFVAMWDYGGVIYEHKGDPAVRLSWGDKWSLVFRGLGDKARPTLERRESGQWVCVRVLRDCVPLDQKFWTSSHTARVQCIGARLCVDVDGTEYAVAELDDFGNATEATWPRKPLRFSVWGADATLRVHRLSGDSSEQDADGNPIPHQVSFRRTIPAPDNPPFEQGVLEFKAAGDRVRGHSVPVSGPDSDHPRGSISINTLLLGTGLELVTITGAWVGNIAGYHATLYCTSTTPPLLSGLVAEFAPLPTQSLPDPIEVRAAVSSLSVDSGDPETLPDAEASLSLSHSLLEQLVPGWKSAILPYRPLLIRAKHRVEDGWTTLFRGFLTPDSLTRDKWNDKELPLIARGPLVRLSEPAALVDERFGPLDLQLNTGKNQLFGAEAAKRLLTIELGEGWTNNFNGDGDAFRYLPDGHYALLDNQDGGYFVATKAPRSGNWRLPPPFGSDLKSWLNSLAKYDRAVWFFDAASNAFFYGRIVELLIERGHIRWSVPETAPPSNVTTTSDWPLLSSLSKSGLLEQAFNDVRVWGAAPRGAEGFSPSFIMGRAGDADPNSLDPISVAQSWRRTHLEKPDFVKQGVVNSSYANGLAYSIWQEYRGRPPVRMEANFETGFLGPRWGEILHLPTGFDGPHDAGHAEDWRILRVKHAFDFTGSEHRFSTTLTTRTLSATGQ